MVFEPDVPNEFKEDEYFIYADKDGGLYCREPQSNNLYSVKPADCVGKIENKKEKLKLHCIGMYELSN